MGKDFDGSYYAKDRAVWRNLLRSPTGISMGFRVCVLSDGVSDDGAQEIADALNLKDAIPAPPPAPPPVAIPKSSETSAKARMFAGAVGANMPDDKEAFGFVYDGFGRVSITAGDLRKVKAGETVIYRQNGYTFCLNFWLDGTKAIDDDLPPGLHRGGLEQW